MVYWWEEIDSVCGEDRGRLSTEHCPRVSWPWSHGDKQLASSRGEAHIVIHTLHHTTRGLLQLWMDERMNIHRFYVVEFMAFCQF